jgi:prepilin-type N-terminal cleavage/methylation domain-containing protein
MLRRERGVTLIELAVVMAIVAIMALFLAPAIGEWVDNFRIKQTAREIVSTLQLAKMKAIARQLEYNVVFDVDNNTFQQERNDPSLGWTPEGGVNKVPRGVDIDTNLASETFQFNPNGTCSNGSITIDNDQGKQYKVVVYYTGRIRIKECQP